MVWQVEELVSKYRSVSKFPSLSAGRILSSDGAGNIVVVSAWSQRCLEKGKNSKFSQTHIKIGNQATHHTTPLDISTELMSAISPSGSWRAVLREASSSEGGSKKQHLEIWSDNRLSQVVDLTLLDQHGEVYSGGEFSCLEWAPCETKLLYVAEKKQPKTEAFYPSKPIDRESSVPEERLPLKGEEFVFRQDWGETMVGKHHPVLCVCDLDSNTVSVLTGVPDNLSVGQALWVPDGVVGVAWPHTPRRLGLVYCTNRLSYIFHLTTDGTFTKLSAEDMAAHSPRLSLDTNYLVWLQRPARGPHHGCHQLVKQVWGALPHILVDIVQSHTTLAIGHKFYGLYCHTMPARCFSDNNTLLLSSGQHTTIVSYSINTETGAVNHLDFLATKGSLSVLDVKGTHVLLNYTSVDTPPSLMLGRLFSDSTERFAICALTYNPPVSPAVPSVNMRVFDLTAEIEDSVTEFNAIYYGPTDGERHSVPLILWPHGGPHSMFFDCYSTFNQFFISAGFATLQVNYRGSTGLGQASVDFLPGRVGDTDVKDCHQAAQKALNTFPCLDPNRVVLYGGSHGGFLVTHLSGQYPDFYKAVVARNPVVELPSAFIESDIPDWAVIEGGFPTYTGKEQVEMPPDFYERLRKVSPIVHASKVKAPTLLNIGKKDLRVPPSQGTLYFHTLNTYNIPCKMNLYDDNHSLSSVPVDLDATINAVLWFQKHLSSPSE